MANRMFGFFSSMYQGPTGSGEGSHWKKNVFKLSEWRLTCNINLSEMVGVKPWKLFPIFWRGGMWMKGWQDLQVWTTHFEVFNWYLWKVCFRPLQLMWVKRWKCVASIAGLQWGMEARWSASWFPLERNTDKFWWPLRYCRKIGLIL